MQDNSLYAALAMAAAATGDRHRAAGVLARLCGTGLAALPRSSSWLATMYGVVECAYLLAEADVAAAVYELLAPFARLPVTASLAVVCLGSVEHCLGMAMLTVGDLDRAVGHLAAAVRANLALGHRPAAALSRSRLAQALARRSGPGDAARARQEATTAAGEAAVLAMVLPESVLPESASGVRAGRARTMVTCRRPGRLWQVDWVRAASASSTVWAWRTCRRCWPTRGGRSPPSSWPPAAPPTCRRRRRCSTTRRSGSTGGASRRCRTRLPGTPVSRAASGPGRNGLAARRVGHRHRSRRPVRSFAGNDERARIAVGKAIRRAVERVTAVDPVIGAQLRATISTGARCCYLAPP